MRIRKNAANLIKWRASSGQAASSSSVICQLNQSPWDAISSTNSNYSSAVDAPPDYFPSSYSSSALQLDSFTGNGSLDDSFGAALNESVASMMEVDYKDETTVGVKMEVDIDDEELNCKEKEQVVEYPNNDHNAAAAAASRQRRRGDTTSSARRGGKAKSKAAKKGASSSPYEFYYYSGFGPRWGKRRGGDNPDSRDQAATEMNGGGTAASGSSRGNSSSSPSMAVFDFVDEEYDDDDDDDYDDDEEDGAGEIGGVDCSKKRMRKPVKARSLKSLM